MQDFRNLRAWQAAHRFTVSVYHLTRVFPPSEQFGLTSQIRRAAAGIGANIAEGCGRSSDADFRRCVHNALGSACEVLNHLLLARDLGLISEAAFRELEAELSPTRRMLVRLIERLETRPRK